MDGDLLSSGRDWELPGLASSAMDLQLKEVFGSDEDEEDTFPLSRGVLGEGGGASQFLFSSIDETLNVLNPPDQSDRLPVNNEKIPLETKPPVVENVMVATSLGVSEERIKMEDDAVKKEEKTDPVRQSARVRSRPNWLSGSLERKPLKKHREERSEPSSQDGAAVKSETDTPTGDEEEMEVGELQKVAASNESSVGEEESDESMESGEETDDDPDKLWCICQQPHNDRFMICCDLCSEWYHGECVGISLAEGKRMEKLGVEYICVKCQEHQKEAKVNRSRNRSLRQERRAMMKDKRIADLKKRIDDGGTDSDSKLFLPDHEQSKDTPLKDNTTRCIGPGCTNMATKPSIYCGDSCIERHVERTLKKLSDRGVSVQQTSASDYVKGAGGVTVFEPATRKILTGLAAPGRQLLVPWIKAHPSYKVFLSSVKGSQQRVRKRSEEEAGSSSPVKSRSASLQLDTETVRAHAKRAFSQALIARCKSADDLSHLTEDDIIKIAEDVEVKLYNVHSQEVTSRYRNRLRSLLFNLKDTKNKGLFRKVVLGEITSKEFVRMSAEQLASEELTQWRESTMRKELKMIKEVAEEEVHLSSSQTIRKMTYKGEVEIEQPATTEVPTDKSQEVADSSSSLPPAPKPALVLPIVTMPTILNPLNNTTSQHSLHIFDQNCDICLGKAPLPSKERTTSLSESKPSSTSTPPVGSDSSAPNSEEDTLQPTASATTVPSQSIVTSTTSPPLPQQPLWKGYIAMHGMETFLTSAYAVSGKTDMLEQVLPETLTIVGRIAHVQVWDYLDKIKSSSSKVIAVIRFDCLDRVKSERAAYITMLDYFMEKHRYGVFQTGFGGGIKDMYLVPLSYDDPVPLPIQPFNGPGLPTNRRNMFLGVITCSTKESSKSNAAAPALKGKRYQDSTHFSGAPKQKKQKVIGFGGSTPPLGTEQTSPSPDLSSPVINNTASTKVSFYGDHTEIKQEKSDESSISQSGIKSILSQLSDHKLQELASAMSSITAPGEEGKDQQEEPMVSRSRTMTLDERISATLGKIVSSSPSSSPHSSQNDPTQSSHNQNTSHDKPSHDSSAPPVLPTVTPSQDYNHPPTVTPSQDYSHPPTNTPLQSKDYNHPPTVTPSQDYSHPPTVTPSQDYSHPPTVTPSQDYSHPPTVTPSQQPDYGHPPNHHPPHPDQDASQYPYQQSGPPYNQDPYYQHRKDDYYQQEYQDPHGYPPYEGRPYDREGQWNRNDPGSQWERGRGSGRKYYDDWDRRPPPPPPSQDWSRGGGEENQQYHWNPDYHRRGAWSKR